MQALWEKGYTVIDGAFSGATCQAFRNEVLGLKARGLLHLNSTHLVKGNTRSLLQKHGIFEAEVADKVGKAAGLHFTASQGPFRYEGSGCCRLLQMASCMIALLSGLSLAERSQCHAGHTGCCAGSSSLPEGQDSDDHAQPVPAAAAPAQPAHQGAAQCRCSSASSGARVC